MIGLGVAVAVALLRASGALVALAAGAIAGQRLFQNRMAATLRLMKQGDAGASLGLMVLCFASGLLHAAGPGHGKFLISGYGFGTGARLGALLGLAVSAALAQAMVAVVLVYARAALLALTRDQLVGLAEQVMARAGAFAMAAIGLWLVWRGGRGLVWKAGSHGDGRGDGHAHEVTQGHSQGHSQSYWDGPSHGPGHGPSRGHGHSHGPSAQDLARVTTGRDAVMLIGAVAMRPCSGALILLVPTLQMGIGWAGVAGSVAMALGTTSVGMAAAALAWSARGTMLGLAARFGWMHRAVPVAELVAGCAVLAYAVGLLT